MQQDDPAASATGSATATSVSRWTATSASKPASLLLGYNGALATVDAHRTELDGLVKQQHKVSAIWRDTRLRDELLKYLREGRDDLVYLFCHARGGVADPAISPPALEFQETTTSKPVFINAADFRGVKLAKHPLVFLNGCNTAAFSPDALSPFIRKLVRDCDVAGVIGTEIPVFELLAGEMASQFLKRFLDGQQAGQALLASRLNLLARGNPLGLVYTLYGVAELTLVQ
ncbi:CHAT domain-containing protein [Bradyrhizobium guangxiense]